MIIDCQIGVYNELSKSVMYCKSENLLSSNVFSFIKNLFNYI